MSNLAATINLGPSEGFRGFGPLGLEGVPSIFALNAFYTFNNVISTTIGVITVVAIIWFTINLLTGAISIISSGGDKNKAEQARNKITASLTGLIIVIAGVFILDLVGTVLGFSPLKGVLLLIPGM